MLLPVKPRITFKSNIIMDLHIIKVPYDIRYTIKRMTSGPYLKSILPSLPPEKSQTGYKYGAGASLYLP